MVERLLVEDCNILNPLRASRAHSILVEDGRITGLSEKPTQKVPAGTKLLDARGGTVLPGLIDTHCHLVSLGSVRRILDLAGATSITTIRLRLFAKVKKARPGEWVIGRGWDQEKLGERRYPTRDDIDDLTPNNPVLLARVCGHVALLNTAAIERLGVETGGTDEEPKVLERDSQGRLTGIIKERVLEEAIVSIPPWDVRVLAEDILAGEYESAKSGLTTIHCILSPNYEQELRAFLSLLEGSKLALRYRVYLPVEALERLGEGGFASRSNGVFKILGLKVFADGSLGARTAALTEPYADDPTNSGILRYSDEALEGFVRKADSFGLQVLIHAIGDKAVLQAVKAIEAATGGVNLRRHRIEHCSLCPSELMKRLKDGGIGVTVQPHFIISDTWAGERVGAKRLGWMYRFKSLLRGGVTASGGSDAPVEPLSPILGMWASIVGADYSPDERLDLREAVQLYTKNAAFNGFDEGELGEIREGYLADLTVLDSDIRSVHPAMLRKVGIAATIVNGRVVYSYEGSS